MNQLEIEQIKKNLYNKEFFEDIFIYDVLESTNTSAKIMAKSGAYNGTVVIAKSQTGGKGRLGRSFYSPKGTGIYISIVLRPEQSIDCAMLITAGAAVAVCRAIEKIYDKSPQIKWVNDVCLNSKKICGILAEAAINSQGTNLDYIVLGIGINISTNDFPENIKEVAGSVCSSSENDLQQIKLIAEVLNEIEVITQDLDKKTFIEEYRKRSCIIGTEVLVISPTEQFPATAIDINDHGHLLVRKQNGDEILLSTGEISIRKIC